jgi:hypothetical protein
MNKTNPHAPHNSQVPASDGAGSARAQKPDDDDEDNIQVDIDESLMNTGEDGLETSEALGRLDRFGRNELEEKTKSKLKVFIGHVRSRSHPPFPSLSPRRHTPLSEI